LTATLRVRSVISHAAAMLAARPRPKEALRLRIDAAVHQPSRLPPAPSQERLRAIYAAPPPVPDAARPDVEIIVADHGPRVREVRAVVKLQGVVRIGRLS
jgi:hypothetical protein